MPTLVRRTVNLCGEVFFRETSGPLTLMLSASYSLVLQDSDYDPTVFGLAVSRLVRAYLSALSHRAWSQHISEGDVTLLHQELRYVVCPVLAQRLVERSATHR